MIFPAKSPPFHPGSRVWMATPGAIPSLLYIRRLAWTGTHTPGLGLRIRFFILDPSKLWYLYLEFPDHLWIKQSSRMLSLSKVPSDSGGQYEYWHLIGNNTVEITVRKRNSNNADCKWQYCPGISTYQDNCRVSDNNFRGHIFVVAALEKWTHWGRDKWLQFSRWHLKCIFLN